MKLNIKATNIELTPELRDYVQKKIDAVQKYLGGLKVFNIDFEVDQTTHHHQKGEIFCAEVNLVVKGKLLRITKTEKDLYKAIDKVKDHLELIIKKYKEKKIGRRRNPVH